MYHKLQLFIIEGTEPLISIFFRSGITDLQLSYFMIVHFNLFLSMLKILHFNWQPISSEKYCFVCWLVDNSFYDMTVRVSGMWYWVKETYRKDGGIYVGYWSLRKSLVYWPNLTSALSVSRTFCPLISLCITLLLCKCASPWKK